MRPRGQRSLGDDAGSIVGIAMLVVLLVNAGGGAVLAKVAENRGVKADHADYLAFGQLYLSTFLLSLTVTVAVGAFAVPRMYGLRTHWAVPVVLVILGAYLTGLPTHMPSGAQTHNPKLWLVAWLLVALKSFAQYYGTAFFGGTVVGAAGGLLVIAAVRHHHSSTGPAPVDTRGTGGAAGGNSRPPQPWAVEVTFLIIALVGAAYLISAHPRLVDAAVPRPRSRVAVTPAARRTEPVRSARFTKVTWGSINQRRQAPYHVEITFVGLRNENCRVVWRTAYIGDGAAGDTAGEVWTGALPYDNGNWWIDGLMVTAPSGHRRWGTHFDVYCRGVLMATR